MIKTKPVDMRKNVTHILCITCVVWGCECFEEEDSCKGNIVCDKIE